MIIDWSKEWKQYLESSRWTQELKKKGITNEDFWDGYKLGDRHEEYNQLTGYPGRILDRMLKFVGSESAVLDIGAGAGAYTIPLAKAARKVTVVEPSRGQVARMMRRAERDGLENIYVINKRWQDVDRAELESYSLVNAAYCFHMPDIREALQKMLDVTTGALFLVSLVDHGITDIYEKVFGEREHETEYIYLYNVLHQMGYPANVEVITRNYQIPLEMQMEMLKSSYDFTPALEQRLMDHLAATGRLVKRENGDWVKRMYKDGMIWYQKD
ncbi:MAG: tRNA (guanine-N(7)-)-methyltransferase [Methanosaeta sp. PtaU1.Bin112]|nr:MAG: tRNA (guanine-N(7)-)-methyltransferase [Methanosaeta sp. PtaU1.Bin112]